MSIKSRRVAKHVRLQLWDVDYYAKLTQEERDYLEQFMLEYYQADFNFKSPIHISKEHIRDCQSRNNSSRRQWHSVGKEIKEKRIRNSYEKNASKSSSQYYTPSDYSKDISTNGFEYDSDSDVEGSVDETSGYNGRV